VSIGINTHLKGDALIKLVNNAELVCVVCSKDQTPKFMEIASQCPSLKYIVQMDPLKLQPLDTPLKMVQFSSVEKYGEENASAIDTGNPEDLFTIKYTSGSTGEPKVCIE
jgi:long-chain acyl-CoA synthetase